MFGITLSEVDVALDIVILIALLINALVISRALEIVDNLYERANTFLANVVAVGTLENPLSDAGEVLPKDILWEDEWP